MGEPISTALMVGKALMATAAWQAGPVATGVAATAAAGAGIKGMKNALTPDIPDASSPAAAPIPDDESSKSSQDRKAQRRYAGQGRSGTVLSSSSGLG